MQLMSDGPIGRTASHPPRTTWWSVNAATKYADVTRYFDSPRPRSSIYARASVRVGNLSIPFFAIAEAGPGDIRVALAG